MDNLSVSACNFGFDTIWIAEIAEQYGPDVLALAIELARKGFTVGFIMEVVKTTGPWLLRLLVEWSNEKDMAAFGAQNLVASPATEQSFMDQVVQKYSTK